MIILTKSTGFDKILESAISKLIDLDAITERLLATDCQQCSLFTHEQVKFAFLKWIEQHIESIEMQPEWFINHDFKHFDRNLPFDELQDEHYPYDEIESDYDQGLRFEQMTLDMNPDNESSLEDDFDGTPEEAALAAINW